MEFDLAKVIEPDSLRGRGLAFSGLGPSGLPIATTSRDALLAATLCEAFQLGRRSTDDVIVLNEATNGCYLYVRPDYRYHRGIARLRFGEIPDGFDVDYVHARAIAGQHGFKYLLLALVPDRINRLHGSYERPSALARTSPIDRTAKSYTKMSRCDNPPTGLWSPHLPWRPSPGIMRPDWRIA